MRRISHDEMVLESPAFQLGGRQATNDEVLDGSSATLPQLAYLRTRFDTNAIIDGRTNSLFAAKIALRRLDRYVPQKKLNLIELTSGSVAQPGAGPTQIVRRQCGDAGRPCRFLHDVPNR